MKIAILTQPLHTNYGGIVQNYALQTVLKRMGHDVLTVDIPTRRTFYKDFKGTVIRIILKFIFRRKDIINIFPVRPSKDEFKIISKHTSKFIEDNIQLTEHIDRVEKISALKEYNFDAYIVGSDQVWRPGYSPGIPTFYLDFLRDDKKTKRITYAASFGVDTWEYSDGLTSTCRKLSHKFDTISVREAEAVTLCKKYFDVNAEHVLDPTLLLDPADYQALIDNDTTLNDKKTKTLMVYVLDTTPEKNAVINSVSKHLKLKINSVMPNEKYSKDSKNDLENCIFPPISQWLQGFKNSSFVVTDSFHGTVFAIIFNKAFIVVGNQSRGLARFSSLLKMFALEDRMILTANELTTDLIDKHIDFEKINNIRKDQKKKCHEFLCKALGE